MMKLTNTNVISAKHCYSRFQASEKNLINFETGYCLINRARRSEINDESFYAEPKISLMKDMKIYIYNFG